MTAASYLRSSWRSLGVWNWRRLRRPSLPKASYAGRIVRECLTWPQFAGDCSCLAASCEAPTHLRALVELAAAGESCLLCLNHRSTLDAPTLFTLLEDQSDPQLFDRIIWIAGRKLEEDVGMTSVLVQSVNRVVVSPSTWFTDDRSDEELRQGRLVNVAAERAVAGLRDQGWVFALFPAGTRTRLDDPSTRKAIEQVQGYLHLFDHLLLGNIDGCTMPVSRDHDLTHESPQLDRIIFTFGPVRRSREWISEAASRYPDLDPRAALAQAITTDMEALSPNRPNG